MRLSKQDQVTVTPGEYLYSIGGFTVAGAMLEVATNKTFEQLMTEVEKFRHKLRVLNERGTWGCGGCLLGFNGSDNCGSFPP